VTIVLVVLAVLLVGLGAAVLVGKVPSPGVLPAVTTESFSPLPRGGVDPEEVGDLRFDQALRGYRMSQVDSVIERLVDELRARDAEIARLRGQGGGADGDL
jgi:DivIVA domain-containing protein